MILLRREDLHSETEFQQEDAVCELKTSHVPMIMFLQPN